MSSTGSTLQKRKRCGECGGDLTRDPKCCDEEHNDPSADVAFQTTDKVLFRVSSWYLKRRSTPSGFFCDIADTAVNDSATSPIPAHISAVSLRLVLDYVLTGKTTGMSPFSSNAITAAWLELSGFADRFDMPTLGAALKMNDQIVIPPGVVRAVFVLASKQDKLETAKKALVVGRDDLRKDGYGWLHDADPAYVAELVRLLTSSYHFRFYSPALTAGLPGRPELRVDWCELVKKFNPHKDVAVMRT